MSPVTEAVRLSPNERLGHHPVTRAAALGQRQSTGSPQCAGRFEQHRQQRRAVTLDLLPADVVPRPARPQRAAGRRPGTRAGTSPWPRRPQQAFQQCVDAVSTNSTRSSSTNRPTGSGPSRPTRRCCSSSCRPRWPASACGGCAAGSAEPDRVAATPRSVLVDRAPVGGPAAHGLAAQLGPVAGQRPPAPRCSMSSPMCEPPRRPSWRKVARSSLCRTRSSSSRQRRPPGRVEAGAPEDLVGQQVAHAGDPLLVHEARLERRRRPRPSRPDGQRCSRSSRQRQRERRRGRGGSRRAPARATRSGAGRAPASGRRPRT